MEMEAKKEVKELLFDEVMILSEILDRVDIQEYVDRLSGPKLDKVLKMIKKDENIDDKTLKGMQMVIALDVFAYISQKMFKASDLLIKLLSSYTGQGEKAVRNFGFRKLITEFKNLFLNGLWSAVEEIVDTNDLKKKLEIAAKK
jgi:hypothetical protein